MERVAFNSQYPTILGKHVWCACVESGLEASLCTLNQRFGPSAQQLISFLEQRGNVVLQETEDRGNNNQNSRIIIFFVGKKKILQSPERLGYILNPVVFLGPTWFGIGYPHKEISIRGSSPAEYKVDRCIFH